MKGLTEIALMCLGAGSMLTGVYHIALMGYAARDKQPQIMWISFWMALCVIPCGVIVIGNAL